MPTWQSPRSSLKAITGEEELTRIKEPGKSARKAVRTRKGFSCWSRLGLGSSPAKINEIASNGRKIIKENRNRELTSWDTNLHSNGILITLVVNAFSTIDRFEEVRLLFLFSDAFPPVLDRSRVFAGHERAWMLPMYKEYTKSIPFTGRFPFTEDLPDLFRAVRYCSCSRAASSTAEAEDLMQNSRMESDLQYWFWLEWYEPILSLTAEVKDLVCA